MHYRASVSSETFLRRRSEETLHVRWQRQMHSFMFSLSLTLFSVTVSIVPNTSVLMAFLSRWQPRFSLTIEWNGLPALIWFKRFADGVLSWGFECPSSADALNQPIGLRNC